jgi:transposase
MPTRDSDIERFARIKLDAKAQRNQNTVNVFYQAGHSQKAIALAFDVSSSTVSRVIKQVENGE